MAITLTLRGHYGIRRRLRESTRGTRGPRARRKAINICFPTSRLDSSRSIRPRCRRRRTRAGGGDVFSFPSWQRKFPITRKVPLTRDFHSAAIRAAISERQTTTRGNKNAKQLARFTETRAGTVQRPIYRIVEETV